MSQYNGRFRAGICAFERMKIRAADPRISDLDLDQIACRFRLGDIHIFHMVVSAFSLYYSFHFLPFCSIENLPKYIKKYVLN